MILHERSPINPKSIYATAKVAADFPTMNYHDAYGVPGVVTRMFNNYGPRQNPRYVTGTIITQALEREHVELGALEPLRDFCFCTDGVRGHLMVAAKGVPGDLYVYGQGANVSMADWAEMILRIGEEDGHWSGRTIVTNPERLRPGVTDVMARVGYEKLNRETGWEPQVSWEEGIRKTIRWYADNRERWLGRVDWLPTRRPPSRPASDAHADHRRRRVPRDARRRAAPGGRDRSDRRSQPRLRPHALGGHRAPLPRHEARARAAPRGRGRRDRRQPRQPGPLLVREPDDGRARARAVAPARRRQARRARRCARTRSSHRCPSARTISGTATRRRRTRRTASRRSRCSSARRPTASSTGCTGSTSAGEPLRARRQLRPGDVARDPGADPEDARGDARRARGRALGRRLADARVPLRRGLRRRDRARVAPLRRERAGQPRHGRGDPDQGARARRRRGDGVRRRDRLGHVEAERPARRKLDTTRAKGCSGSRRGRRSARASPARSPGTASTPRRMRVAERVRALGRYEPWIVLAPLVAVQWLVLLPR